MSLRWLSSMLGGRARTGVRWWEAPLAQHGLAAEIDADALTVQRVWARRILRDPDDSTEPERAVIVWVDAEARPEVAAWLERASSADAPPEVRTDWIFFPSTPEAVLMGVVESSTGEGPLFRFNVRFDADACRRHLEILVGSGLLGLTTAPLQIGPDRQLESPCVFVPIQRAGLRAFLREILAAPVV